MRVPPPRVSTPSPNFARSASAAASSRPSRAGAASANRSPCTAPPGSLREPTPTPSSRTENRRAGRRVRSNSSAARQIARVLSVGAGSETERVIVRKSSYRTFSVTVRPVRPFRRSRRATWSARCETFARATRRSVTSSRKVLSWETCFARRSGETPRPSIACASRCRWAPCRPNRDRSTSSGSRRTSPTVRTPSVRSFASAFVPTPQSRPTGSGSRNATSPPAGTTTNPRGFSRSLATFATNFTAETPTLHGRPSSSRTASRMAAPIVAASPNSRREPVTSRNASSKTQRLHQRRVTIEDRPDSAATRSRSAENRLRTTTASGHRRRTHAAGIAECTPKLRAS